MLVHLCSDACGFQGAVFLLVRSWVSSLGDRGLQNLYESLVAQPFLAVLLGFVVMRSAFRSR